MLAVADTFWLLGVVFLCLIPVVFFLRKTKPPEGHIIME
jgi:hypothetical protein